MRRFSLAILPVVLTVSIAWSQDQDRNRILGEWVTAGGESRVDVYRCDSLTYCGKIVWLRDPLKDGKPLLDDKNPEDSLKTRPVLGLLILRGFTYAGDRVWSGGKIYDPKSGNDYSAKMSLVDDQNLDLRGYVLVPLFGRTEKWTRPQAK
jgi:uncharacterized protein (DUF2147 family)